MIESLRLGNIEQDKAKTRFNMKIQYRHESRGIG